MPKEQKKRGKRLLKSIPLIALINMVLVSIGDIRPDLMQAAFGSRVIVWFYMSGAWAGIVLMLYYATKAPAEVEDGQ